MKPWSSASPLTAREWEGLRVFSMLRHCLRRDPTLREIAEHIGARDKTTVARIVQTLKLRGAI